MPSHFLKEIGTNQTLFLKMLLLDEFGKVIFISESLEPYEKKGNDTN